MSLFNPRHHYVAITAFYALSLTEYDMHPHAHPSCEIMYVTKGKCYIYVNQEEYCLEEHQFIFLDSDILHRLWVPQGTPCSLLNLEFCCQEQVTPIDLREPRKESPAFASFCRKKCQLAVAGDSHNLGYAMKDLISQLGQSIPSHTQNEVSEITECPDSDYLTRLLFFRTILELSRCLTENSKTTGAVYLKKACSYINSHLMEEIRVPEVAAHAGINKSYLQSLFSRHMHCTITDYVNRKRLEQAAFLLINSSLSITDIAFHAGYNSRQHFGNTFEKYYNVSPRAYRQLHGKTIDTSTGSDRLFLTEGGKWHKGKMTE